MIRKIFSTDGWKQRRRRMTNRVTCCILLAEILINKIYEKRLANSKASLISQGLRDLQKREKKIITSNFTLKNDALASSSFFLKARCVGFMHVYCWVGIIFSVIGDDERIHMEWRGFSNIGQLTIRMDGWVHIEERGVAWIVIGSVDIDFFISAESNNQSKNLFLFSSKISNRLLLSNIVRPLWRYRANGKRVRDGYFNVILMTCKHPGTRTTVHCV